MPAASSYIFVTSFDGKSGGLSPPPHTVPEKHWQRGASEGSKQDQQQTCDAEHGPAAAFGHPVRLILAAVPAGPAFSGAYFTSMRSSPRMMEATTFTTSFMSSC